jgi:hypothetical protein
LEALEELNLVAGEQYIIYGMDYVDEHSQLIYYVENDKNFVQEQWNTFDPDLFHVYTEEDIADSYVEVTFTGAGQGFYVLNDSYTANSTRVDISVEDVQAFSNGVAVDLPDNVGFYGSSSYFLQSTLSADIIHKATYQGVQFQTSKSKYDDVLPLTIRIKFKMLFSE